MHGDGAMYEVLMDIEEENEDDVGMKMVRMFGRCIGQMVPCMRY